MTSHVLFAGADDSTRLAEQEMSERAQVNESDIFLGGQAFSSDEQSNLGVIYKWLDDIMWTDLWDNDAPRKMAYKQLEQLADLSAEYTPSMAFAVGQALYSYFWFRDNGPDIDIGVATRSIQLHEVSLNYSGCDDLTLGVGAFIAKACTERWLYLIMLCAEVGIELALSRTEMRRAADFLQKADSLFHELMPYPYFSFRKWESVYDINTNSHVFSGPIRQMPVWPTESIPLAGWFEENAHVFKADLDLIIENNLFDALYFAGHVSMTQFSPRRESWAPLNLIHNKNIAPNACKVANQSCELLLSRPEIAQCDAKDVGAAFARLQPGMSIKPHFWTAPPRLGIHLGLITPPGATMAVGNRVVEYEEGRAVVFDDTYIHSVRHKGTEDRYLLIAWFCHPCDDVHAAVPTEYPEGLCTA